MSIAVKVLHNVQRPGAYKLPPLDLYDLPAKTTSAIFVRKANATIKLFQVDPQGKIIQLALHDEILNAL